MKKVAVIGSGIVGLTTARELLLQGFDVTILEKEHAIALHQTGRNSNVIHSGIYYAPGSQKALLAKSGAKAMYKYAKEHDVAHKRTGKLIVATEKRELAQLDAILAKAEANGVKATKLDYQETLKKEPHSRALASIHVPSTGIVDYSGICKALLGEIISLGGEILYSNEVIRGEELNGKVTITTDRGVVTSDFVVNCAGLYSDKIAASFGVDPEIQIVPFRGEYYSLRPELNHLVKGLIYPVPDPRFPFLGVHLTTDPLGGIHAGPNAVFALAREGYDWKTLKFSELKEAALYPGFRKLAMKNVIPGTSEIVRSLSPTAFAKSLSRLVPGISKKDLIPAPAGVRAQALKADGSLVDDFFFKETSRQLHVLNAPSPAATASFSIASVIAGKIKEKAAE